MIDSVRLSLLSRSQGSTTLSRQDSVEMLVGSTEIFSHVGYS